MNTPLLKTSRTLLATWLTVFLLVGLSRHPAAGAEIFDVGNAVTNVIAWPNLTRLSDGSMLLAGFNKPSHLQTEGDVSCWVSQDEGDTWTYRADVTAHEPLTARANHALGLNQYSNVVALVGGWTDDYDGVGETNDHGVFRAAILRPWVCVSDDNGQTWVQTNSLPADPLGRELIPFGDISVSAGGRLNVAAYSTSYWDLPGAWKVFMLTSADDGYSWQIRSEIVEGRNETALLHVGHNEWLVAVRGTQLVQYRSTDDGLTWQSEGAITGSNQYPGHLLELRDGTLLLSYGDRNADSLGVWAKWSYDRGQTWQAPVFLSSMASSDGGYPASLERDDGKIVTCFYTAESGTYNVKRVIWSTGPGCAITSPSTLTTFDEPADIDIQAAALDGDGSLTGIVFLADAVVLGTVVTSPYAVSWTNVPAGTYDLSAVAQYSDGHSVTYAIAVVTVIGSNAVRGVLYTGEGDNTSARDRLTDDGSQDGVLVNDTVVTTNAAFGTNAYSFGTTDPDPDAIDIPGSTDLGSAFTLSAFVRSMASGHQRLLSDLSGNYKLIFDFSPSGAVLGANLRLIVNGTQVKASSDTVLDDGNYHHIAAVYDSGQVSVYVDGIRVKEMATAGTGAVTLDRNLRVGEDISGTVNNEQLVGDLDDLLILKTALASNQVAYLSATGAVAYLESPPAPDEEIEPPSSAIDIGSRRELFLDYHLIESLTNAALVIQTPVDEGIVFRFDQPWEGRAATYVTVIQDGALYRMYYRGQPTENIADSSTCYAWSTNGIDWARPNLGLHSVQGTTSNNVILTAADRRDSFAPFLDKNPNALPSERFKATAAGSGTLVGYTSPDGIHWSNTEGTILAGFEFDSLNVAFWSEAEEQYLCYYRDWVNGVRRIGRAVASDFGAFTSEGLMEYDYPNGGAPVSYQQHYINGTHPYLRAPHHYIALAADLYGVDDFGTDGETAALYMSARPGSLVYDRLFPERYIIPPPEVGDQIVRSNFAAENMVQTGPRELSLYLTHNYRTESNNLRRYSLRLDGFVAASVTNGVGELLTKPFIFSGDRLKVNYLARTNGSVRVEIQTTNGTPVSGYALADAAALTGDEIGGTVSWRSGNSLTALAGTPVQLRFVMENADLFAMQFASVIENKSATDITQTAATLNGDLSVDAPVRVSWGLATDATNGIWDTQVILGPQSAGPLAYAVSNLLADTLYAFTFAVSNETGFVDAAPIELFGTAFGPEQAPTHLVATLLGDESIGLQWTDRSETETGFQVERAANNGTWELDQITAAGATQAVSVALAAATHYDYRVQAVNAQHTSAWSNVDGADTSAGPKGYGLLYTGEGDATGAVDRLTVDGIQNGTFSGDVAVNTDPAFGSNAFTVGTTSLGSMELAGSTILGDSFTIAACVKTSSTSLQRIFSRYDGAGALTADQLILDFDTDNNTSGIGLRLIENGNSRIRTLPAAATDGAYHHYAATYGDGEVRLYFDGALLGAAFSATTPSITLENILLVGADAGGANTYRLRGSIDDIMILPYVLSSSQVAALAGQGSVSFLSEQDRDGDGMNDWDEEIAGTDSGDADSVLGVQFHPSASGLELQWPGAAGRSYAIDAATNLVHGFTVMVAHNLSAEVPTNTYVIDPVAIWGAFRVRVE